MWHSEFAAHFLELNAPEKCRCGGLAPKERRAKLTKVCVLLNSINIDRGSCFVIRATVERRPSCCCVGRRAYSKNMCLTMQKCCEKINIKFCFVLINIGGRGWVGLEENADAVVWCGGVHKFCEYFFVQYFFNKFSSFFF